MRNVGIEVSNIAKSYRHSSGKVEALAGVDLRVVPGSITTLIGPSGCGKSTLLRLIAGLEVPDSGQILLSGRISNHTEEQQVSYMPQHDVLLPWRTVLDNVTVPLEARGIQRCAAREQARDLLANFGLDGFATLYPHRLSGGMRQRAAFLRTIIAGNQILLLDEPFGALDALTRTELQDWLLRLQDEHGWTILFVTHDVIEAVYMGDRVMVLSPRPGQVVLDKAIELPRPRSRDMLAGPRFAEQVTVLLRSLGAASVLQL